MSEYFIIIISLFLFNSIIDTVNSRIFLNFPQSFPRNIIIFSEFGFFLFLTGSPWLAFTITTLLTSLLTMASTLKYQVLGEPLIFSDLAVAASFLRYPRFYMDAVPKFLRIIIISALIFVPVIVYFVIKSDFPPHSRWVGIAIMTVSGSILAFLWKKSWSATFMTHPDLFSDVRNYGLIATLFFYFLRWRREAAPAPLENSSFSVTPDIELLIIIQCESFADPVSLSPQHPLPPLPTLTRLQEEGGNTRSGQLDVSGFGAYTMRTEYAVLFGQDEKSLGFRYFDPFLTAHRNMSYALPNRLSSFFEERIFLHPHDLRFYNRTQLMPQMGFTKLISTEAFSEDDLCGSYVGDLVLGKKISEIIEKSSQKTQMIYAVTMENHGPWKQVDGIEYKDPLEIYDFHLRNSDLLLDMLDQKLSGLGKKAVLAFFGDHRPSIPGYNSPGHSKSTPFVIKTYHSPADFDFPQGAHLTPAEFSEKIIRSLGKSFRPS
ncbi:LTA synthase family protein [Gluconobacter aidae]|uniref:Sulfatase-like hydrolase/transferase n=1 Tax=Gluconobacter aidae TaxID=2662454 RepID=A0A7X1SN82_9PROT|nr:LTA synthase family protein [Gluconobacter aidae]MQR98119.1 sulfatase-like hydrolase/transferase [Gluconobacter aidae]